MRMPLSFQPHPAVNLADVSCQNLSSQEPPPRRIRVGDAMPTLLSLADRATKSLINGTAFRLRSKVDRTM